MDPGRVAGPSFGTTAIPHLPAYGGHPRRFAPPLGMTTHRHAVVSSRRSHARAAVHSRLMVAGDASIACAVSSMLSPTK